MPAIAIDVAVLLPTDIRAVVGRMNARFDDAPVTAFASTPRIIPTSR